MSELLKTPEAITAEESSPQDEKKTPSKRGRMSFIERAQKESEELVKNMGGSLELEGGRRTRSSTRGTPSRPAVVTPPPVKKARNSPDSPNTTPRARVRGRKLETTETPEPPEQQQGKEEEIKSEASTSNTVDASSEKPETNGPEKSAEGDDVLKKEKSVEPETQESENKQAPAESSKKFDQIDDAMKPVEQHDSAVELGQLKEESASKETMIPVADVDLSMDVDEPPGTPEADTPQHNESKSGSETVNVESISNTEKLLPSVETGSEPAAVESQLISEPMEVDLSSKSSDAIECTDVVEKHVEKSLSKVTENEPLLGADNVVENLTQTKSKREENGTAGNINPENDVLTSPPLTESTKVEIRVPKLDPKTECVIESKEEKHIDDSKLTPSQMNSADDSDLTTKM